MNKREEIIEARTFDEAILLVENELTIRETADAINSSKEYDYTVSKSTVYDDLTKRLPEYSPIIAEKVKKILDKNKAEFPIRGGIASHKKRKCAKV